VSKPILAVALTAIMLVAGCGSGNEEVSSAQQAQEASLEAAKADAEKAKAEAEKAKAEAEKAKAEAQAAQAAASTTPEAQAPALAGPADPVAGPVAVPDVIGLDHQLAQDTMQAAGLYNLSEEDATGAGRLMVLDRNWVVVEQVPAAGTKVAEDATITLRSKKKGE
jgi:beta-lactam-binding protein with PASTA domain